MLPHHYALASEWGKNKGEARHWAEVYVDEILSHCWEYRCFEGNNREGYVTGMTRMIEAYRQGDLKSLGFEFDVEADRFGDFFCWEHCAIYEKPVSDGGCRKADSFRRAKQGETITLVDLAGVDVLHAQALIESGKAKVRM